MLSIIKKELRIYFNSPIAYIFLTVFLFVTAWLFFRTYFLVNQANMRVFFDLLPWIFLFMIPALTMRLLAEEKKLGTIEVLLTLPLADYQIIIGKFLASLIFLSLSLLLSSILALVVMLTGQPDIGVIIGSYFGALLLGSAMLAIGLYLSALTNNQIIAFILSVTAIFLLLLLGSQIVTYSLPNWLAPLAEYLGLMSHYSSLSRGVIDSRDVIYYLSVIALFLFLNIRHLQSRQWK